MTEQQVPPQNLPDVNRPQTGNEKTNQWPSLDTVLDVSNHVKHYRLRDLGREVRLALGDPNGPIVTIILERQPAKVDGEHYEQAPIHFHGVLKKILIALSMTARTYFDKNPDTNQFVLPKEAGTEEAFRQVLRWLENCCTNPKSAYKLPTRVSTFANVDLSLDLYQVVNYLDIYDARLTVEQPIFDHINEMEGLIDYPLIDDLGNRLGLQHKVVRHLANKLAWAMHKKRFPPTDPDWVEYIRIRPLFAQMIDLALQEIHKQQAEQNRAALSRGGRAERVPRVERHATGAYDNRALSPREAERLLGRR